MVNRSIQQKILKMKRRGKSRVYGKQTINTGSGPVAGSINSMYRHKLVDTQFDHYLNSRFPGYHTSIREIRLRGQSDKQGWRKEEEIPLGRVYDFLYKLKEELGSTEMKNHFKVQPWMDLFFSADKTVWRLVETRETFIRKSSCFASKSLAIQALQLQVIKWVETVPLPGSPLFF